MKQEGINTKRILNSGAYTALLLLIATLSYVFILEGDWFYVGAISPPVMTYTIVWVIAFGFLAGLMVYRALYSSLFDYVGVMVLLLASLCVFYLYTTFFLELPLNGFWIGLTTLSISFYLIRILLESKTWQALLVAPIVIWISFCIVLSFDAILFA